MKKKTKKQANLNAKEQMSLFTVETSMLKITQPEQQVELRYSPKCREALSNKNQLKKRSLLKSRSLSKMINLLMLLLSKLKNLPRKNQKNQRKNHLSKLKVRSLRIRLKQSQ